MLVFAVSFTAYLVCGPVFLVYDGDIMYRVSESLLWQHSVRITDPLMHLNEPYATYGPAVSVLLMPLVAAGQLLFHDGGRLTSLYQPAVTAATVVVVALVAREIGCSWRTSLGLALLYGFGTLAWDYSNILFSEPLIALATVVAFLGLLRFRNDGSRRWLAAAGGAVALAVLGRTDSLAVVMLPFSGFAFVAVVRASPSWPVRVRALAAYGLPVAAAILLVLGYDGVRYGGALRTGYLASGVGFTFPFVRGFLGLLVSPAAGIFVFMPVLAMAVAGFPGFVRRHRAAAILVACLVGARLLFYASWWGWDGGDSWGPRFLVPVLPVLVLPLAFVSRRVPLRVAISALAAMSIAIELLGQLVSYYTLSLLAAAKPWELATRLPELRNEFRAGPPVAQGQGGLRLGRCPAPISTSDLGTARPCSQGLECDRGYRHSSRTAGHERAGCLAAVRAHRDSSDRSNHVRSGICPRRIGAYAGSHLTQISPPC